MSDASFQLPVIDICSIGLLNEGPLDYNSSDVICTADQLCDAFRNVGFVYIKNHGISDELLDEIFKLSDDFFTMDQEKKNKFKKRPGDYYGYQVLEQERAAQRGPGDVKECFNIAPSLGQFIPRDNLIPGFQKGVKKMENCCRTLSERCLSAIALGLKFKNPDFFKEYHNFGDESHENVSQLKLCYYPPVGEKDFPPDQFRCGPHTDYGSVTFAFQDNTGGLEVRTKDGEYLPVTPIPGTAVVNIGDLMQRWTADQLVSHTHRVVIPSGNKRQQLRKSVIFYAAPDTDAIVRCVDGSGKYPATSAREYLYGEWYKAHKEDEHLNI